MGTDRDPRSVALAAEVWRVMLDYTLNHRDRIFGILKDLGLTPGDMKALLALEPGQGRPMRSLAQVWHCDASNVTWMVDRLEAKGYVERHMLASDRRVKAVALTDVGILAKKELLARIYEPPDDLLALDRSALEALRAALTKLPAPPQRKDTADPVDSLAQAER